MFHLFGIFGPGPRPDVSGGEAPFKQARFGDPPEAGADDTYSKAESDEAFLTCKCPEARATPESGAPQLRFVELFTPPYF